MILELHLLIEGQNIGCILFTINLGLYVILGKEVTVGAKIVITTTVWVGKRVVHFILKIISINV